MPRPSSSDPERIDLFVSDPEALAGATADAGLSRAQILRGAMWSAGALSLGGITIAGLPRLVGSASAAGEVDAVIAFLLSVERVQAAFYAEALAGSGLSPELRAFVTQVAPHEEIHVKTLGGAGAAPGDYDFGDATSDPAAFTAAAILLEDLVVEAYNGQAANLPPALRAKVARVISVDARHAAWIRAIDGQVAAEQAIDPTTTLADARKALDATGYVR